MKSTIIKGAVAIGLLASSAIAFAANTGCCDDIICCIKMACCL
jgi:hypothetical protein